MTFHMRRLPRDDGGLGARPDAGHLRPTYDTLPAATWGRGLWLRATSGSMVTVFGSTPNNCRTASAGLFRNCCLLDGDKCRHVPSSTRTRPRPVCARLPVQQVPLHHGDQSEQELLNIHATLQHVGSDGNLAGWVDLAAAERLARSTGASPAASRARARRFIHGDQSPRRRRDAEHPRHAAPQHVGLPDGPTPRLDHAAAATSPPPNAPPGLVPSLPPRPPPPPAGRQPPGVVRPQYAPTQPPLPPQHAAIGAARRRRRRRWRRSSKRSRRRRRWLGRRTPQPRRRRGGGRGAGARRSHVPLPWHAAPRPCAAAAAPRDDAAAAAVGAAADAPPRAVPPAAVPVPRAAMPPLPPDPARRRRRSRTSTSSRRPPEPRRRRRTITTSTTSSCSRCRCPDMGPPPQPHVHYVQPPRLRSPGRRRWRRRCRRGGYDDAQPVQSHMPMHHLYVADAAASTRTAAADGAAAPGHRRLRTAAAPAAPESMIHRRHPTSAILPPHRPPAGALVRAARRRRTRRSAMSNVSSANDLATLGLQQFYGSPACPWGAKSSEALPRTAAAARRRRRAGMFQHDGRRLERRVGVGRRLRALRGSGTAQATSVGRRRRLGSGSHAATTRPSRGIRHITPPAEVGAVRFSGRLGPSPRRARARPAPCLTDDNFD